MLLSYNKNVKNYGMLLDLFMNKEKYDLQGAPPKLLFRTCDCIGKQECQVNSAGLHLNATTFIRFHGKSSFTYRA